MNSIAVLLFSTLLGVQSFAGNISAFQGKYEIGNCPRYQDMARVYASVGTTRQGESVLNIQLYGDESRLIVFSTHSEMRENPNFKYGNPIKNIVTKAYFSQKTFINETTYLLQDGSVDSSHSISLTPTATGMVYGERSADGSSKRTCEFIRIQN